MPVQGNYITRNNNEPITKSERDTFYRFIDREFQFKLQWYNGNSAERRLQKAIKNLKLSSLEELQSHLHCGKVSFQDFINLFTVNVTEVFREPNSLNELRTSVLPFFRDCDEFKVLLVGSSTGEELATLCIILKENGLLERSEIVATDIDKKVLEQAFKPKLNKSNLSKGQKNYLIAGGFRELDYYFLGAGSQAFLDESLLKNVQFKQFDICHSNLNDHFDLIICKNVLIYFQYAEQHRLINNLGRHMNPKAFLALGEKESIMRLSKLSSSFASVSTDYNIYRKN